MLSLAQSTAPDALLDALSGLVALLHPDASIGPRWVVLSAAREAGRRFLRKLRHHLHEHSILLWALKKAEPASIPILRPVADDHEVLRDLSHEYCRRLRSEDVRGSRAAARLLLRRTMDHQERERNLFAKAVRRLDLAATRRFADALFDRMLSDMAARQDAVPSPDSVADLHSLYVRLIRHLQGRPGDSRPAEVAHEHPCSR